jgi:hypothetical protein
MSDEELEDYINNGTLNSRDTDRAWRMRDEFRFQEGKHKVEMPE